MQTAATQGQEKDPLHHITCMLDLDEAFDDRRRSLQDRRFLSIIHKKIEIFLGTRIF